MRGRRQRLRRTNFWQRRSLGDLTVRSRLSSGGAWRPGGSSPLRPEQEMADRETPDCSSLHLRSPGSCAVFPSRICVVACGTRSRLCRRACFELTPHVSPRSLSLSRLGDRVPATPRRTTTLLESSARKRSKNPVPPTVPHGRCRTPVSCVLPSGEQNPSRPRPVTTRGCAWATVSNSGGNRSGRRPGTQQMLHPSSAEELSSLPSPASPEHTSRRSRCR